MTDRRFHVKFKDDDSGESLGLMLQETPQVGLTRRLINPYAAKTGQGDTQYSDLTEWTVVAQDDWRGGRGQDRFESKTSFFDSMGVETRIEGQVTLGPYAHAPTSSYPANTALVGTHRFGWPDDEVMADVSDNDYWIASSQEMGQQVSEQHHTVLAADGLYAFLDSVDLYLKKESGYPDGGVITVAIYSDSDGLPGTSLGSTTLNGSDLSTTYAWETFDFGASSVDLNDYDPFWIVVSHDQSSHRVSWMYGPHEELYPNGYAAMKGTAWRSLEETPYDFLFKVHWGNVKQAESFDATADVAVESISVRGGGWRDDVKVSLYSDSGGNPDSELASCVIGHFNPKVCTSGSTTTVIKIDSDYSTDDMRAGQWVEIDGENRMIDSVDSATQFTLKSALTAAPSEGDRVRTGYYHSPHHWGWIKARFASSYNITNGTTYWIVVEDCAKGDGVFWNDVKGISVSSSASGTHKYKVGDRAWTENDSVHLLYQLNAYDLDDDVVAFAIFSDNLYCAAGDTVYQWNNTTEVWSAKDEVANKDVTDLITWGGYLWAARGSDNVMRRSSDGASWSDTSENANLLARGGGYLYYSGTGANSHKVYYSADGSSFDEVGACGAGDYDVTGLAFYRDQMFAATQIQLWSLAVEDWAYPVLDWSYQEDDYNGKGMAAWNKTNCLYIPLRYGLYRWNGDSMVAVGPEQGTGLPEERAGNIVALCPTNNWLYAAVDAGANNLSSILCYNGMGGWHEIARDADTRKRIYALAFSTLQTPSRLWYGLADETRYCELPDRGDNPFQWQTYAFNPYGTLTSSWMGYELIEVVKDIHEIVVRGEDIDSAHYVQVFLQVDRNKDARGEPLWVYWGEYNQSPREAITWGNEPDFKQKLVGSGSTATTIEINSDYTVDDVHVGDFVRINNEVSQVQSVGSDDVTLAAALDSAPEAGDYMYAAAPAGHEFRLLLALYSEDVGDYVLDTPKITSVLIRYQNNVLDRFLWTLQVDCDPDLKDLGGADYPLSAAELRAELDTWAQRQTPFTLVDQDGREFRVKVTSAGEGGFTRKPRAGGDQHYSSTYNFNLVEIE